MSYCPSAAAAAASGGIQFKNLHFLSYHHRIYIEISLLPVVFVLFFLLKKRDTSILIMQQLGIDYFKNQVEVE